MPPGRRGGVTPITRMHLLISRAIRWVFSAVLSTESLGAQPEWTWPLVRSIGTSVCSWPSTRTHGRGEEAQLSRGWISIGSELSSLNLNSSVTAEQLFVIHHPRAVIKSLCCNLDICLNYFRCFWSQTATERARCFFTSRVSIALLNRFF